MFTWSENKRRSIPPEVSKHLSIAEKLAEVNVKQVATLLDHDVVIVTVADTLLNDFECWFNQIPQSSAGTVVFTVIIQVLGLKPTKRRHVILPRIIE